MGHGAWQKITEENIWIYRGHFPHHVFWGKVLPLISGDACQGQEVEQALLKDVDAWDELKGPGLVFAEKCCLGIACFLGLTVIIHHLIEVLLETANNALCKLHGVNSSDLGVPACGRPYFIVSPTLRRKSRISKQEQVGCSLDNLIIRKVIEIIGVFEEQVLHFLGRQVLWADLAAD